MVRTSFAALTLLLGLRACNAEPGVESAFRDFARAYGRTYASEEEEEERFAIFQRNYAFIEAENAKGRSYELAVNEFADQAPQEFQAGRLGLLPPPAPGKLWAGATYLGMHNYSGAELPEAVDWSQQGAVTKPKNQQQCGSCWAFSTTGALEGAWQIATGKLVSLSEQELVDCAKNGNQGCNGGSMDLAFEYLEKHAACTEASYPYQAKDKKCRAKSCSVGIPAGSIKGFKDVRENDEKALMEAVSQQPVSVAIEADQMAFQLYKKGILTKECGTKLDHGVLLVGYGTEDGVDYWKVKNSWGASWGEDGYIRMERGVKKAGECGINSQPSYPIVKKGPAPVPPSPSPPAPSPAPPAHYGAPPCESDEIEAEIEGASGVICAPPCDIFEACPSDTPAGTTAQPECALRTSEGDKYCALPCDMDEECPKGAACVELDDGRNEGLCLYPEAAAKPGLLKLAFKEGSGKQIVV